MASRRSHAAYHCRKLVQSYVLQMRQYPFGELYGWRFARTLRCFAACSEFHDIGPAPQNLQLILNLLAFVAAWLRRDAIAS